MTGPAWLSLFAESEPQATVDLLQDPDRFILRANEICRQLEEYIWDQERKSYPIGPMVRVEALTGAIRLNGFLISLKTQAHAGQSITGSRSELVERWNAFWLEGGTELNNPESKFRQMYKQRDDALDAGNKKRVEKAFADHTDWQAWADEVWAKRPELYKENVAREIIDTHKIAAAVGTVADILKKPISD